MVRGLLDRMGGSGMNMTDLANREPIPELPRPKECVRLRKAFGITQDVLAKSLGVSRQTIIAWEYGRKEPMGEKRNNYAAILAAWSETERQTKEKGKRP
jgi:DNA-binding XRE family transcriptional regulator